MTLSIIRLNSHGENNKILTNSVSDITNSVSNHKNPNRKLAPRFDMFGNPTSLTHHGHYEDRYLKTLGYDICSSINGTSAYNDVIKCINNVTYILRAYWIGYYHLNEDQVVVGICKFCKSFYSPYMGRYVPLDFTNQCLTNRTNQLCSSCVNDTAPAVNSRSYTCIECNPKKMTIYFSANIICLFILLAFIFIFNFFPASGALNPLIFFAQMITTTLRLDCMGTIPMTSVFGRTSKVNDHIEYVSDFVYGIWNLDFTYPANSFCFAKSFETIDVLVINYFVATLPLIPVAVLALLIGCLDKLQNTCERTCKQIFNEDCVYYSCCKCLRALPWLQKMVCFDKWKSIRTLVASCLLLSYTKFAVTTIYLITPSYLYYEDGTEAEKVLYYQGNLKYFGPKHKRLGILAIFILVTFVIGFPLLLLLLRYKPLHNNEENDHSVRASIGKHLDGIFQYLLKPFQRDLKWGKRNSRPCVGFKVWRFSFGIHDYRWYAGWYFILRFSLFAANLISLAFTLQLILNQALCTLALIISLIIKPYRYQIHNYLDAFILFLISFTNATIFLQYYLTNISLPLNKPTYVAQYILVFIPQVLIIIYFFAKLVTNYRNHDNTARDEELEVSVITPLLSVTQTRNNNQQLKRHFLCNCYVNDNEEQEENVEKQQQPRNYGTSINTVPVPHASNQ